MKKVSSPKSPDLLKNVSFEMSVIQEHSYDRDTTDIMGRANESRVLAASPKNINVMSGGSGPNSDIVSRNDFYSNSGGLRTEEDDNCEREIAMFEDTME